MKFDGHTFKANQRMAEYRQRLAKGMAVTPTTHAVIRWLKQHRQSIHPLLPRSQAIEKSIYFDLTVPDSRGPDQVEAFSASISQHLQRADAFVGIGRYNENRHCYQSDVFRNDHEARSLHIGLDLFVPAMTELRSPLPAAIHSFQDNAGPLDYGPTIILKHTLGRNCEFFSLYGHLSPCSLDHLYPGKEIQSGESFASVGNYPRNGNWPPHVHVQLITDMLDMWGDFPGVVASGDAELWLQLCPDPGLLLSLPKQSPANTVIIADS